MVVDLIVIFCVPKLTLAIIYPMLRTLSYCFTVLLCFGNIWNNKLELWTLHPDSAHVFNRLTAKLC